MIDTWEKFFVSEIRKTSIKQLVHKIYLSYQNDVIYPAKKDLLNVFKLCPFSNVKCIIVGQDPYHEPNQAMGLAFSVNKGIDLPPSLVNIFKEYQSDLGYLSPKDGDLSKWAKQGVLLINSILTVKKGQAFSCNYPEYQMLFNDIINILSQDKNPKVFILWGNSAQKCKKLIDESTHLILQSCHPSPLSCYRGFFNSKPFSKTNEFLKSKNRQTIDWKL